MVKGVTPMSLRVFDTVTYQLVHKAGMCKTKWLTFGNTELWLGRSINCVCGAVSNVWVAGLENRTVPIG